jgi:hypothetical protein
MANIKDKQKVFRALRDPNWDWRTMEGLEKDTGLSAGQIFKVVTDHISKIEITNSREHGVLFRLKVREQKDSPLLDKALDYLSLGKRKKVA